METTDTRLDGDMVDQVEHGSVGDVASCKWGQSGIVNEAITEIRHGVEQRHVCASDGGVADASIEGHERDEHGIDEYLERANEMK